MSDHRGHDHRVHAHLGVHAHDYDAQIRRFIPRYEEMIATTVSLARGDVIDLGAGTGALAAAILAAKPTARVKLVDIDPAMLETARQRVAQPLRPIEAHHAGLVVVPVAKSLPRQTGTQPGHRRRHRRVVARPELAPEHREKAIRPEA